MIKIIGIGPGHHDYLTHQAVKAVSEVDVLIGTSRQLEQFSSLGDHKLTPYTGNLSQLEALLKGGLNVDPQTEKYKTIGIVASGDPSLFGISKFVRQTFPSEIIEVIPGISSVQILFAKVGIDMNDIWITSSHGRPLNYELVFMNPKVAILTDQITGPYQIAREALRRGHDPLMIVGEQLSYGEERMTRSTAKEIEDKKYEMNVVILINER